MGWLRRGHLFAVLQRLLISLVAVTESSSCAASTRGACTERNATNRSFDTTTRAALHAVLDHSAKTLTERGLERRRQRLPSNAPTLLQIVEAVANCHASGIKACPGKAFSRHFIRRCRGPSKPYALAKRCAECRKCVNSQLEQPPSQPPPVKPTRRRRVGVGLNKPDVADALRLEERIAMLEEEALALREERARLETEPGEDEAAVLADDGT